MQTSPPPIRYQKTVNYPAVKTLLSLCCSPLSCSKKPRPSAPPTFGISASKPVSPSPTNTPQPLRDGKMTTYEGSAVATTSRGELLFYTNGETVWDRAHHPMPNGQKLMGSGSSTQSALIVPDPGSGNIFYIFTVAPQGTPQGLRYSTVDMTRQDGLGDLPRVNALLIQPVAEKLAAVRHAKRPRHLGAGPPLEL